ncbi:GNAT family N-acetyltransferase [Allomuricauda sp. SCSIO 65647]|uniref:GNAT family N-acetyltransferase n=1 Tax=Allomuricauda sp. SCSIO 65647 TaxID=2908843 RepID=UPI001F1C0A9A|nr:GNAT family protein [Muricauda sp. SCSIO 65647]UJH67624.1 GNAT family N-acetyltransferase [Muricauda sp. SCSIO 65647]
MLKLKSRNCYLRALEPEDLDFLYHLENNTDLWEISGTITPFSKEVLRNYLDNSHRDVYEVKQLRLCICNSKNDQVGLIDLFDFDPKNLRAGLGIVVLESKDRNKGIGQNALTLMIDYAFSILNLHQLYANILEDNKASLHLFEKMGFKRVGLKKDWIKSENGFKNEVLYQKLKSP